MVFGDYFFCSDYLPYPPDVLLVPMALINHKAALGCSGLPLLLSVGLFCYLTVDAASRCYSGWRFQRPLIESMSIARGGWVG